MRKLSRYNEFIQNENLAYRQEKVSRNYNDFTHILLESRRTEDEALNILRKKIVDEGECQNILNEFKELDKSEGQKNLDLFARLYIMGGTYVPSAEQISGIIDSYEKLRDKKRIEPLRIMKGGLMVGNQTFTDFIKFSEYIHGIENLQYKGLSVASDFKPESKFMWSGNGIEVYDGTSVGSCIAYSQGKLTGKSYSFCIGKPGGKNAYQGHRDSSVSTFYFIVDRNKFRKNADGTDNLDDPLHIIVFDNTKKGIVLTDGNNRTGTLAEPYGKDVNKYLEYLKSKGVPLDRLIHKPKTPEEEKEQKLLGQQNKNLDWFKKLNPDQKFNYLGRGHQLTDEQFDYVNSKGEGPESLLEKYVSTGAQITQYQFGKLNKNLKNSYFHSRILGADQGVPLADWEVGYLISNNKNDDLEKHIEKGNEISNENFSKLSDHLKDLYIKKGRGISDENFSKLSDELKNSYFHYRMLVKWGGPLEDWEVGYLISNNKNDDLDTYFLKGDKISDENFSKLSDELQNLYFHYRMLHGRSLEDWEVGYLISNNKNDDLKKYFEKGNKISDENFNKLSEELKELYLKKYFEKGNEISNENFNKLSEELKELYFKSRMKRVQESRYKVSLLDWEVGYLISNNKNDDLKKYFERGNSISYEKFNKLSDKLKEVYFQSITKAGFQNSLYDWELEYLISNKKNDDFLKEYIEELFSKFSSKLSYEIFSKLSDEFKELYFQSRMFKVVKEGQYGMANWAGSWEVGYLISNNRVDYLRKLIENISAKSRPSEIFSGDNFNKLSDKLKRLYIEKGNKISDDNFNNLSNELKELYNNTAAQDSGFD